MKLPNVADVIELIQKTGGSSSPLKIIGAGEHKQEVITKLIKELPNTRVEITNNIQRVGEFIFDRNETDVLMVTFEEELPEKIPSPIKCRLVSIDYE